MTIKGKIYPSARKEKAWIGTTYGITDELDAWTREIVATADKKDRPLSETSFEDIDKAVEELHSESKANWKLSWKRFREEGWLDRLRALRALIKTRQPPYQLKSMPRIFAGLGGRVPVEVIAHYDINLTNGFLTFTAFESYKPNSNDWSVSDQAEDL